MAGSAGAVRSLEDRLQPASPLVRSGDGTWERVLDGLRAGCDEGEGADWTAAIDSTVVRAHQHAAGARHEPPKDIDPARLASAVLSAPGRTGGWVE